MNELSDFPWGSVRDAGAIAVLMGSVWGAFSTANRALIEFALLKKEIQEVKSEVRTVAEEAKTQAEKNEKLVNEVKSEVKTQAEKTEKLVNEVKSEAKTEAEKNANREREAVNRHLALFEQLSNLRQDTGKLQGRIFSAPSQPDNQASNHYAQEQRGTPSKPSPEEGKTPSEPAQEQGDAASKPP